MSGLNSGVYSSVVSPFQVELNPQTAMLVRTNTVKNLQQHIQNRLKSVLGNLFYRRLLKWHLLVIWGRKFSKLKLKIKRQTCAHNASVSALRDQALATSAAPIEGFHDAVRTLYALRPGRHVGFFWNNKICFNFVSILLEKFKLTVSERTYITFPMV